MDLFWIAGTILIAVLGFNLLRWIYQKGLYWVRDGRKVYMEEVRLKICLSFILFVYTPVVFEAFRHSQNLKKWLHFILQRL